MVVKADNGQESTLWPVARNESVVVALFYRYDTAKGFSSTRDASKLQKPRRAPLRARDRI